MDDSLQSDVEAIIHLLYGGVMHEADWYAGAELLRQRTGGACFHQLTVDRAQWRVLGSLATLEAPPDKISEYEQQYAGSDERMSALLSLPAGQAFVDHQYFEARGLSRSAVYNDWLPSIGLRHTMGFSLREEGVVKEVLGIMRARADGEFGQYEVDLCRRVAPHLARASALRTRAAPIARKAVIGMAALDAMPTALVVLDATAAVHHINAAGRQLAHTGALCRVRQNIWRFSSPRTQAWFELAVKRACGTGRPSTLVEFSSQGPISISLLSLNADSPLASPDCGPLALMSVTLTGVPSTSPDMLRQALDVTQAEARLAHALAPGSTVKSYALQHGISVQTARDHLKSLMGKTGTHRQVELVTLIQSVLRGLLQQV